MILVINDTLETAEPITAGKFADLDVLERKHIQEWVRTNPTILGEDLLIVSMEFDQFEGSKDRIDLLALDRDGNLVVIELKRDKVAGHADLQAIRYAAMMSSMTLGTLAGHYVEYLRRHCQREITLEEGLAKLTEFIEAEQLSVRPRIILCAQDFSQEIKQTALWLNDAGIRVTCVTLSPYRLEHKIVIVPDVIIPLVAASEYASVIRQKQQEREKSIVSNRLNIQTLVEGGLLRPGETVSLKAELPEGVVFKEDDPTFQAVITGKSGRSNAVRWAKDGQEYSISRLAWKVFKELRGEKKEISFVSGKRHWVNSKGKSLGDLEEDMLRINHVDPLD